MRRILHIIPFLFFISSAEAAYLDLSWGPNGEPDLAGYRVYYGAESREYINFVDVGDATSCRLGDLLDDVTYFVTLTAYDTGGNESDFSEEVSGVGFSDESGVDFPEETGFEGDWGGSSGCFLSVLLAGP